MTIIRVFVTRGITWVNKEGQSVFRVILALLCT
jgi:hypothetical protein